MRTCFIIATIVLGTTILAPTTAAQACNTDFGDTDVQHNPDGSVTITVITLHCHYTDVPFDVRKTVG